MLRIAPVMTDLAVESAHSELERRREHDDHPARPKTRPRSPERAHIVLDVLQDIEGDHSGMPCCARGGQVDLAYRHAIVSREPGTKTGEQMWIRLGHGDPLQAVPEPCGSVTTSAGPDLDRVAPQDAAEPARKATRCSSAPRPATRALGAGAGFCPPKRSLTRQAAVPASLRSA